MDEKATIKMKICVIVSTSSTTATVITMMMIHVRHIINKLQFQFVTCWLSTARVEFGLGVVCEATSVREPSSRFCDLE